LPNECRDQKNKARRQQPDRLPELPGGAPVLSAGNEVDPEASAEQRKAENAKRWPDDK
jgi:hypothetical protein